jgi:tetratricopeptide (TPR) repeat protein
MRRLLRAVSPLAALLFLILGLSLSLPTPSDESAATDRIDLSRRQGRPAQALYHIEAQVSVEGWTPELLKIAGDVWRDVGDLTRAVPYWEAAAVSTLDDRLLMRNLTEAYLVLHRWPQAVDQLAWLIAADSEDAWAHYHLGLLRAAFDPPTAAVHLRVAERVPEYRDVAAAVGRIIENQPTEPLIGMSVGLALADADLWAYAELAFQHAADVGQVYPEALAYVGLARDRQGLDGSGQIAQAVALDSQSAIVRFIQGLHLRDQADLAGSRDALIQAVALDPENPAYYAELGTAYRLVGDIENAGRWLRVAVALSNQDSRFQELLALFYAEESLNLEANIIADLESVVALMPENPDVQAALGWALHQAEDTQAALEQLDSVLNAYPDHPRSLLYKARIWLEIGQMAEARALLAQIASAESPVQAEALRLLEGSG